MDPGMLESHDSIQKVGIEAGNCLLAQMCSISVHPWAALALIELIGLPPFHAEDDGAALEPQLCPGLR